MQVGWTTQAVPRSRPWGDLPAASSRSGHWCQLQLWPPCPCRAPRVTVFTKLRASGSWAFTALLVTPQSCPRPPEAPELMCPPEGSVWGQETSSTTCKILKSLGLAPPRKRGVECPPYSVLRGKWKEGWKKSPCPSAALGWLAALPAAALRAGRGTRRAEESGVESASHSKVWAA